MQFKAEKKFRVQHRLADAAPDVVKYPHQLDFYTLPPTENISLQEFEDFAVERLKVLKAVETVGVRHVRGTEDHKNALQKEIKALNKQGNLKGILQKHKDKSNLRAEELEDRRRDHISHFILRLAYNRTEELRRWFIQQEMDLFRFRFNQENSSSIYEFLRLNNLDYSPIPESEKNELLTELSDCMAGGSAETINFYKVPFTEALDLVRNRKVYLQNGFAYVPHNDLIFIILSVFRINLSHALAVTSRALPQLEEDDRLLPMLNGLSNRYLGQDYVNKKPVAGNVTADMIDGLSKTSFPMCMQQVHHGLRQTHHLKHWGRMQYGLFLKGIGLSLDEAMRFWRAEFTKTVDSDKFDKQYAYNIRHNYGKEGKRADYTPYSCVKIITTNAPGPGDHHGCPFKQTDGDLLRQNLLNQRVPKEATEEILDLCKTSHYQLACGRYFEWSHKVDWKFNPNHPNHYFEESQKVLNGDKPQSQVSENAPSQGKARIVPSSQKMDMNSSVAEFEKEFLSEDMECDS